MLGAKLHKKNDNRESDQEEGPEHGNRNKGRKKGESDQQDRAIAIQGTLEI